MLIIALSSCESMRVYTKNLLLYQQRVILNIASVLLNDDINEDMETTLYEHEDKINEDCYALQRALILKIDGKEISSDLKSQIFNELDGCENTVQEADSYLNKNGLNYW